MRLVRIRIYGILLNLYPAIPSKAGIRVPPAMRNVVFNGKGICRSRFVHSFGWYTLATRKERWDDSPQMPVWTARKEARL